MRTFLLSIIVISFLSCHKSDSPAKPEQKYFNPDDLSKLDLDSVPDFWENSIFKIDDTFFPYIIYPDENNKGVQYHSKNNGIDKNIGVSVFETQEKAIAGMKFRITDVSAVILEGTTKSNFQGEWWYNDGSAIFVNQWNTIIEVTISISEYKDVEKELIETAAEIAKRVDKLSSVIE